MFDARRPFGWLFLLLPAMVALAVSAQTLPTTTINDTVYRADGTPAGGTLLISWPEFTTAAQGAVAAGNTSVTLGAGGALSVGLVPNANATPANTIYSVVYQLDDGTVKTEYWVVPTTSPTTISAVRTTLGAGNSASQMATQQFVNTALAGKANDAAVVHLNGPETIVGTKQFTVAPGLPTPVNPTDAANKAYVDNATQNVGNGSYLSTAGGTMTGPLTLSGDPVAPTQAATKRYADLGLAAKADLVAGLVPGGELGTGTANNTLCLHGDSTWGACGSSSNAVSIQNVPVATTTPTNNQVMTYVASLGEYAPQAGGGVTAGMQAVKYATDFSWSQSPATNLSIAGAQTVNLPACPTGVTGTEPWYYVYISGTGTPEAVLITGGTCTGNGQAGTLQFTTLNAHPAGYTIASASGGLEEALIAARFVASNPSGPSQSGKVIVPPGELQAYARISVRASNVTVDFSGSIVNCYMQDSCIFAGDPSNSTAFLDITLVNPRGRPMLVSGQSPFIEVNAQKTRLVNVTTRIPPTGGTFSSYVQVDNDQSFLLDGLDTSLATGSSDYGVLCNASVCNPVIYAPGPFSSNAAVGWLKNLNISLQCAGNGIDWQSGNTVKISDSVIEGFAQYGVRAGTKRGGYGGFELDNVYEEVGSCSNPAGAIGEAGVIAQGATVRVQGSMLPVGLVPQFANTGSTDYRYYIVANSATSGASNPLYAGRALTNGSGNITVTTPDVAGASTFDLLRVTYLAPNNPREQAPYGTGSYAVANHVTRASACSNGVCTFTDTQAALQSYTVAPPAYFPLLDFWPGNLILTTNKDSGSVLDAATAWMQDVPSDVVGVQGMGAPAVISPNCNSIDGWTPLWLSCYTSMSPGTFFDQGAFLLAVKPNQDGGLLTNLKGRLNFPTLGSGPGHIITLSDSNFQKTIATANNRPSNDANDAFIGYDQGDGNPAHVGISVGAPVSLSSYIGNVGDGTNWLERLTSGLKEFKTNVQLDNALTVAGTAQANSLLTTGAGLWAVQGSYGTLSPALAGKSAIGFGASGKLQVSENGGAVVGVAELDSNGDVSENANTATHLAQTPTQCNGSFATGVQANGNANCSVADVIQLAETGPPSGIPNYGIFWFDSTCHCPKVISNNGQAVQLGLLNVFNFDANTLEEYDGANPQTLNVYGTRTDASDYERMRLGYDTTDGYFLLGADALGTGTQRGLGFWLQGSLRWVIDPGFNLKPWSDNVKDVGSSTLRLKHLYTGTYVDTTGGAVVTELPNATTTGTTLNKLAKVTGAPASAITASTSDTSGVIGVVVDGAGTTQSAEIARGGQASCVFDAATSAGDYVQISSTTAGDCHDAGASYPGIGQVLGRVLSTNASTGTYAMLVAGAEIQAPAAGNVNTVFGRAGTITAQTGDYSVGQVTGAASLASPTLTGTPTAPTQATSDNSTAIATDAWVKAQGYGTGGPTLGSAAQIPVMNAGATAYAPVTVSGDSTVTSLGVMTNSKLNNGSIPASKTIVGTNGSSQIVDASAATLANNTSGTAANLSGTPTLPAVTLGGGATVPSLQTLTIASGATLTCAAGSTCPGGGSGITGTLGLPVIATASTTGNSQPEFVDAAVQAGASYCDQVSAAFTQAVAVGAAVVDARGLQGSFTCTAAQAQGMFPNPIPWTLGTEANPAVGGMTLLMGATVLTIQSDKTNLGVPGLEIPSTVTIKGLAPSVSIIRADNTGCGTAAATTCTNWGVRYYTISAASAAGSGPGRYITETIAPGVTNTATGVCTAGTNGISRTTQVVTIVCSSPHGLLEHDLGRDIVIAGSSTGCGVNPNGTFPISGIPSTTTFTYAQSGADDAGCGTGNTGTIHLYSIPRVGEFLSSQSLTGTAADDNFTFARVCGTGSPTLRGGCTSNPSNTSITFYNAPYDGSTGVTTTNGGNLFLGTPLISLGPGAIQQSGLQSNMRHVVLQDVEVNCQGIPGCIAIQNVSSQEGTHIDYTTVQNSQFLGWDLHNGGSSGNGNSGPYTGNYILVQGTQFCNYTSVAAALADQFTREYNGMTINYDLCPFTNTSNSSGTPGPPGNNGQPHWAVVLDGPNYSNVLTQWHVEGFDIGEQVGSQQPTVGITLEGMHGQANLLECVDISNNFSGCTVPGGVCTTANGTGDINIQRVNHGSGGGCPKVIVDNIPHDGITNNNITGGNNGINDIYAWDQVSPTGTNPNAVTLISTDANLVNIFDGGIDIGNGGLLTFNGSTSGSASITAAAVAGTPATWVMPTANPTVGQVLSAAAPSGGKILLSWAAGAAWGAITGTLSAQTDLQNALNLKAPLASPAFTGTPTVPGYARTGTLVSGNYTSATAAGTIGDSTVVAGPYAIGWMTELTGGNNGVLPSSSANKAMMWGVTLTYPLNTSQVTYDVGSNADNTATNNYDLGLFNSSGTLILNLNSGTLHGSSFAPATGAVTLSWAQGTKTLQPGDYYLMYYTSNTTTTPPTLVSPSATAFTFYKGEAGGSGTCGTTQGSGGFAITPLSGGALPVSIAPPANSYSWGACLPAVWIH